MKMLLFYCSMAVSFAIMAGSAESRLSGTAYSVAWGLAVVGAAVEALKEEG